MESSIFVAYLAIMSASRLHGANTM